MNLQGDYVDKQVIFLFFFREKCYFEQKVAKYANIHYIFLFSNQPS